MQTGGKIALGSSSGKAPSGCCDPRKAGEFGAENSRVRHRFAGVRHRLAEAGEAAFPPWARMEHHRGQRPLPRPRNPAKPRTKKRDSQRNADHKKALPPGRKKPAFPAGLYSWCAWTLRGDHPTPARKLPQKSAQKKEFSEAIKRRASIAGGHPAGHYVTIVRGESVRNWTHKKGGERFHAPRFPQFHDRFSRRLFFTQSDR